MPCSCCSPTRCKITTANAADVLSRRAQGLPVESVALIGQKSEQGFAVGADSGINTVQDFIGKKLGYKGTVPIEFLALAAKEGIDPGEVQQVSVGYDPRVLSEGQVDILSVFVSNEPDLLDQIGYKVKVFDPSAFGIPALGLTYVATGGAGFKNNRRHPPLRPAAIRGIQYAADHPDEALDIVMKYAPQEDRSHQSFMMNTELARAKTDLTIQNGYGWQTLDQWQKLRAGAGAVQGNRQGRRPVTGLHTKFLGPKTKNRAQWQSRRRSAGPLYRSSRSTRPRAASTACSQPQNVRPGPQPDARLDARPARHHRSPCGSREPRRVGAGTGAKRAHRPWRDRPRP